MIKYAIFFISLDIAVSIINFATKTNYNDSLIIDSKENFFTTISNNIKCDRVIHISSLYRHGSRYPSLKDVNYGKKILKGLRQINGNDKLEGLKLVLDNFSQEEEKSLSKTGFEELEFLASKLKKDHVELFDQFEDGDFQYYVTNKQRTIDSFTGFVRGIKKYDDYKPIPIKNDYLLRFFDLCSKYENEVDKNKSSDIEVSIFMKDQSSFLHEEILKQYTSIFHPYNFTLKEISSLYKLAGCEVAVFGTNMWSLFLNPEIAEVLEYGADLKNYWKKGGGYQINYLQSCDLLKHLFDHFDQVFKKENKVKGSFYFGHAETLLPLFTLMGLFNDSQPLTSSNYLSQKNRKFKTTRIIPFAGNIRFELRKCDDGHGNMLNYIGLLMKDHAIKWPSCDHYMCPYESVKAFYGKIMEDCDFNAVCKNNTEDLRISMYCASLMLLVLMMIF